MVCSIRADPWPERCRLSDTLGGMDNDVKSAEWRTSIIHMV
jgi:hypothetical protein